MFDLTGKVAIITGGSRGIGRAVALTLARQGAEIAFLDRLACTVEDHTRDDVEAMGRRCVCLGGDVTDAAACGALVEETLKELGRVDILVNNAGITRDDLIMRMTDKAWADVLAVNLTGAFNMTRAVMRPMIKARAGRIINMSSVSGQMGNAGQANYSASKAGLIGLTKATAAATSSTEAKRPSGVAALMASLTLAGKESVSSVTTKPGATALQVMPRDATSRAVALVRPMRPALDDE